jgi:pimeloyl-ACP methyl ester carboxylesterase
MSWPPDRAMAALYPDCPPDLARWAADRLRRQTLTPHQEPCSLGQWPDVAASVIYGRDDAAISAAWLRRTAQQKFNTTAQELPGGHSPFLARPAELADLLLQFP